MYFPFCCPILAVLVFNLNVWTVVSARATCPPVTVPNGQAKIRSNRRVVNFRCKRNFELVGVKLAVCLSSGQWSQKIPTCVGTTCKRPALHASLTVEELYKGGILKFTCEPGLTRSGPESIMCDGEKWSDKPPTCEVNTAMGCDFENEWLCGWSHDNSDDFDWTWSKGETPTAHTGPSVDHTTNTSEGHYLFMESSAPQKPGHKTRIISPQYNLTKTDMCLEFFYHMFGPEGVDEVGNLDVFVKPVSMQTVDLTAAYNIFHQSGSQGDSWMRAAVEIPRQSQSFQLVFQATRMKSWTADIAIDDVKVHPCSESRLTTTQPFATDAKMDGSSDKSPDLSTRNEKTKAPLIKTTPVSDSNSGTKAKSSPRPASKAAAVSSIRPAGPLRTTRAASVSTMAKTPTTTSTRKAVAKETKTLPVIAITTSKPLLSSSRPDVSMTSGNNAVNPQPRPTIINNLTSMLPLLTSTLAISDNKTINGNIDKGAFDNTENSNNDKSISEDDKRATPFSDYIDTGSNDYNFDTDSISNRSLEGNDSSSPFRDYDFNNGKDTDAASSGDENVDLGRALVDNEAVESGQTSLGTKALLPLIIGVVVSVVVGATVIAVLAWIWVRSQRQKEDKEHDDQMNIITEYVETNLSI